MEPAEFSNARMSSAAVFELGSLTGNFFNSFRDASSGNTRRSGNPSK